jgi:hypothetical protein
MQLFLLDVDVMAPQRAFSLRLSDEHGRHLGASQVRLDDHPARIWEGLFNTRAHAKRFAGVLRDQGSDRPLTAPELLERLGAFLGQHVLGPAITNAIAAGIQQRTLIVRLPDPSADPIAAALARVPWEIARVPWEIACPARDGKAEGKPLQARNVVVRAVPSGASASPDQVAAPLQPDEPLRVLLVHAEAPGSMPLAARLEREKFLYLFASEVMPKRRVTLDILCHGVTRERLRERIQDAGGYHIVHWSGHGQHDALELASDEGAGEGGVISGADLVALFASAGGFLPQLMFLSACHSGSFVAADDWTSLQAYLRDRSAAAPNPADDPSLGHLLAARPGRTGTAFELLRAGVPQVVAMRFEVGDAYARELALLFYRSLLAQDRSHAADAALAMARAELSSGPNASAHNPVDHATPLLFGAAPLRFEPARKPSPQLERLRPRPQPILPANQRDLDPRPDFVGREAELTRLASSFFAPGGAPLAWIEGPPGVGKTALAAEAIHVWHGRFDLVLACRFDEASPPPLDAMYRRLASLLTRESPAYRERCRANELAKVYLDPAGAGADVGDERLDTQRDNLLTAMLAQRILLVLSALTPDASWEAFLSALAGRLRGGGSRALITGLRCPPSLANPEGALNISLGPLPTPA